MLRKIISAAAYRAIASGIRFPTTKATIDFTQWGRLIDLLQRLDINVFIDVGANRGFYSKHLRMAGYSGHIFSFEPIPEDCEQIALLCDGDPKWRAHCMALGAENGTKDFNVNIMGSESVLSSFLPLTERFQGTRIIPVSMRRLDGILSPLISEIRSPRVFLKMDTQGFDWEVMKGAKGCIDIIHGIQSEISVEPIYKGMPHYTESLASYEKLGFKLMDLFVVNRTDSGSILEYDCLMARL